MTKTLSILGSTGSIGVQALDVCETLGIRVTSLAAYRSTALLEQQARKFHVKTVAVVDETAARDLKIRLGDTDVRVLPGMDGVCACAADEDADTVLNSVVGMAGLRPTLTAIEANKTIALANKETLVAGGALVTEAAKQHGVAVLPVDSEHSAIFQCLQGLHDKAELKSIILTASGGPFFGKTRAALEHVTVAQALNHPNWSMGAKITVDSATMMNKGLEIIEASWLFAVDPKDIEVVVHPQSAVHSAVEFADGSIIAQIGAPDMRLPIAYALSYPERLESPGKRFSFTDLASMTFERPDLDTFKCLKLAYEAIEKGGSYPAVLNCSNEEAVAAFLAGRIRFVQIADCVEYALDSHDGADIRTVEDIFEVEKTSRSSVRSYINNLT